MISRNEYALLFATAVLFSSTMAAAEPPGLDLAAQAAQSYRDRARYPEWSHPVRPGQPNPIAAERRPTRQSQTGPDGADPVLSVWNSEIRYESGEAVELHAQLEFLPRKDLDLLIRPPAARVNADWVVTGVIESHSTGEIATVTYRDDGRGADRVRFDGVYSARFVLPSELEPDEGKAENITVKVTAASEDGVVRKAMGGFLYSNPAAALTGRFRERIQDGDLILAAEVEVEADGRFYLTGALGKPNGAEIATGQAAVELAPGRHWIDLPFYGLILNERGVPGPYRLSSITLTTANAMPNALGPLIENAYLTRPYAPAAFHERAFGQRGLIEAAERLENKGTLGKH